MGVCGVDARSFSTGVGRRLLADGCSQTGQRDVVLTIGYCSLANISSCPIESARYLIRVGRKVQAVGDAGGSHFQGICLVLDDRMQQYFVIQDGVKSPIFFSSSFQVFVVRMLLTFGLRFNAVREVSSISPSPIA